MKNDNFKWHAISLMIFPLIITSFFVGLFTKSTIDDKYIALLIGLLIAIFAFWGVAYSKKREWELKELELFEKEKEQAREFEENKEAKKLERFLDKKEEAMACLSDINITVFHSMNNFYGLSVTKDNKDKIAQDSRKVITEYVLLNSKLNTLFVMYKISNQNDLIEFQNAVSNMFGVIAHQINNIVTDENPSHTLLTPNEDIINAYDKAFSNIEKSILNSEFD